MRRQARRALRANTSFAPPALNPALSPALAICASKPTPPVVSGPRIGRLERPALARTPAVAAVAIGVTASAAAPTQPVFGRPNATQLPSHAAPHRVKPAVVHAARSGVDSCARRTEWRRGRRASSTRVNAVVAITAAAGSSEQRGEAGDRQTRKESSRESSAASELEKSHRLHPFAIGARVIHVSAILSMSLPDERIRPPSRDGCDG